MHTELNNHFTKLESLKAEAYLLFTSYPEEVINAPAAPGKWGAIQHMAHIISSETLSLAYMKKKIQGFEGAGKAGLSESFRSWLLNSVLKSGIKFKAPPVLHEPKTHYTVNEIFETWDKLREEYRNFLSQIEEPVINARIFKHPVAGRFNPPQALSFMSVHLNRHLEQAKDILAKQA